DDDELGAVERRLLDRGRVHTGEVDVAVEAGVATGLANRARVAGVMRRERHRVAAIGQEPGEPGPPGSPADDHRFHERRRKSIATGTPSSSKRSRSSFSTQ